MSIVEQIPEPATDWISQRELAALLKMTEQTACHWAKQGRLRRYEHGLAAAGRKKYSRQLVERERRQCWQEAIARQDELLKQNSDLD
jgi:hypothetical protein